MAGEGVVGQFRRFGAEIVTVTSIERSQKMNDSLIEPAHPYFYQFKQEGLAVASIARDDPSTLPGDDPFPRARMHRDRNAR